MLPDKDITKIQEIKTLFQDSWTQPEFFSKHLDLFKFSKTSKLFLSVKQSDVPFWDIMKIILVLPFEVRDIFGRDMKCIRDNNNS